MGRLCECKFETSNWEWYDRCSEGWTRHPPWTSDWDRLIRERRRYLYEAVDRRCSKYLNPTSTRGLRLPRGDYRTVDQESFKPTASSSSRAIMRWSSCVSPARRPTIWSTAAPAAARRCSRETSVACRHTPAKERNSTTPTSPWRGSFG